MPPRPKVNEDEITEAFLKGSGPGGQKINKTSSAVQLKHLPTGIVVKSQETRSRSQNRKIARLALAEKLELLDKGDESRVAVKAAAAKKKKQSRQKKSRRKYRKLDDDAKGQAAEVEDGEHVHYETPGEAEAKAIDERQ
ncbi:MAG: mannose-ethanolamine phosphotransferase gpi13 [Chaenotheca gracillima]|nr:MAG: mannose-ethanolamine phosphotransferase gpi13 [Chaenotheca gracillima]